jgi:hypothetical protein
MYFDKLGTTTYNDRTIPDIFKRIIITNNVERSNLFEKYSIMEGETPESLSFNYYGSVNFYWTILLINSIKSRYFDWPMGSQELDQYVNSVYGNKSSLFFNERRFNNVFNFCDVKYVAKNALIIDVLGCDRNINKLEIKKVKDTELKLNDTVVWLDANKNVLSSSPIDRIVYENENSLHHFEDIDYGSTNHTILLEQYINGVIPSSAISNIVHELQENDKKREIYLIKKQFINQFINEFALIAES